MKYVLSLFAVEIASLFYLLGCADGTENADTDWRPEAHRVAIEALTRKYPELVTQDAEFGIYRYSTSNVLERTAHAFSFLVTPDKSKLDFTSRCDVIISRYRGQVYSFVFGEPTCYQVQCTEEESPYGRSVEKICRKF